jgi:hypothetical protein
MTCRDDVCMIVERVVLRRTVLIGPVWMTASERQVLLTKSVQVDNYSIYKALNARAKRISM